MEFAKPMAKWKCRLPPTPCTQKWLRISRQQEKVIKPNAGPFAGQRLVQLCRLPTLTREQIPIFWPLRLGALEMGDFFLQITGNSWDVAGIIGKEKSGFLNNVILIKNRKKNLLREGAMNFWLMSPMIMLIKVHVAFRGSIFNTGHLIQKSLAPSQASYFTYTHTHRYPNTHIQTYTFSHMHMYTYIPTDTHVYPHTYMQTYTCKPNTC